MVVDDDVPLPRITKTMFGCGVRTQFINGRREKFVRLVEADAPAAESPSSPMGTMEHGHGNSGGSGFHMDSYFSGNPSAAAAKFRARSVRVAAGVKNRSERLQSIGAVFQEDFRKMSQQVFDPQDAFLARMNRAFVFACIVSVAIDPLFLYLLAVKYMDKNTCIGLDGLDGNGYNEFFFKGIIEISFIIRGITTRGC